MAQQALGMMMTMFKIVKVYQTINQKKVRGLQTMRDLLVHKRHRGNKGANSK